MSKRWIKITFPVVLLIGIYFLGPQPRTPRFNTDFPSVPQDPSALENFIATKEARHKLKPNNEARIVWYDSTRTKTPYSIVYLHGFSASQMEGDPVHRRLANEFGCNLYLSRLADHGIDTTDALMYFTGERFFNSAKEALAIGHQLGEKVIVVSTSTGGTVALMLAAYFPDQVHALVNFSPNVALRDPAAFILNNPWGLHIARMVVGGKSRIPERSEKTAPYWNESYRVESLVQLEELLEETMNEETFAKIKQPCLSLYYFKSEKEQDEQVSVEAILKMNDQLSTPDSLKVIKAVPDAGDHVIGSALVSKDVETVYQEASQFLRDKVGVRNLNPIPPVVSAMQTTQ
jgi:pimeloyl-ACP methyl ester carboxylesterase